MPLTANRTVSAALWIALVATTAGAGMVLAGMWRGLLTPHGVPLVGAALFLCAAGAVGYALVHSHTVGLRVRALQDVEHDLRTSEAKFAGILDIAAGAGRYLLETMRSMPRIPCAAVLRDYKSENVTAARALAQQFGVTNVTVHEGDAFDRSSVANA